jgi:hypothetical protein
MRLAQHVASLVAVSLLGLAPLTLAAPANAIESAATAPTLTFGYKTGVTYGESTYLTAKVLDKASGENVYDGATQLQASIRGGAWRNVGISHRSGGYVSFDNVKPTEKTKYRIVYTGAIGYSSARRADVQYTNSVSNVITLKVARKVTAPKRGLTLKGKVTPQFSKKKITIKVSKRQNRGCKKWKVIRTDAKGKYKVKLPKIKGTRYWQVVVPKDSRFERSGYAWRTWVY